MRALNTTGSTSYACKSKMVIGRRGKSKKVTGEASVEEETDLRTDRGDGRCLPLPNDVGRIQNGRVAADGRPDGRGRTGDGRTEPWTTFEGTGTGRERERDDVGARLAWMGL